MNPESVEFLRDYNDWRREAGRYDVDDMADIPPMPDPKEIGEAIDWACEQIERMQWRPIDTAPKDGTRILLFRPLAERTNDDKIDIKRGIPRDRGCWKESVPPGLSGENYTDGACRATHWMPLPHPPGETK